MGLKTALIVLVLVSGCTPVEAQQRVGTFKDDSRRILREMRAEIVMPLCEGDTEGLKACGLLVFQYRNERKQREFASRYCFSSETVDDRGCFSLYQQAFAAAVTRRYDHADASEVESRCAVTDCSVWQVYELETLANHNDHVLAKARREMEARNIQDEKDQEEIAEHKETMRRVGEAIRQAGDSWTRSAKRD